VLLLNPPGRRVYIRDYYCSKVSQANYVSHPIDLVAMSARLKSAECQVHLTDAIADGLSIDKTLHEIRDFRPDAVLALAGAVSWEEDRSFFERVKGVHSCRLIVSGDLFQEGTQEYLRECDFLDALILDFTSPDIVRCVEGGSGPLEGIVLSFEGKIIDARGPRSGVSEFGFPSPPLHEMFQNANYRYPFTLSRRYGSVLTEFGCPFRCEFCIMGKLGFKRRSVENVLAEQEYLVSLNVREIFFVDQTFASGRERTLRLLSAMIEQKWGLSWFAFSRVDVLDQELLTLMKKAGCHTLILGIESGSDAILSKYRKGYDRTQVAAMVRLCSRMGIRTVGTFILGLPEETETTTEETLRLLRELPLDYASFNVAVPRAGTDLRREAVSLGLAPADAVHMDQSGSEVTMPTRYLTRAQIGLFRRKAVRQFYLTPGYLLRRLTRIRTPFELLQNIQNGLALLRNTWGRE
jgi:hypothetical protein